LPVLFDGAPTDFFSGGRCAPGALAAPAADSPKSTLIRSAIVSTGEGPVRFPDDRRRADSDQGNAAAGPMKATPAKSSHDSRSLCADRNRVTNSFHRANVRIIESAQPATIREIGILAAWGNSWFPIKLHKGMTFHRKPPKVDTFARSAKKNPRGRSRPWGFTGRRWPAD
jgi:hypothetical protein